MGVGAVFDSNECRLVKMSDGTIVGGGKRLKDKIYLLDMRVTSAVPEDSSAFHASAESLEHYHRILGHASAERVKTLLAELGIEAVGSSELRCPDYPAGKAKRAAHPATGSTVTGPGVVHVDLSGIVNKESLQGFRYYLLAKDVFTEFVFVYFCKAKSEVQTLLARLIIDFEQVSGATIRELHSDNGSEFVNQTVKLMLLKEKISQFTSAPFCPQQNGIIEREMQTITQTARVLLNSSGLVRELWDEAVATSVYLKNRLPTKRSRKTPFERLTGGVPDINHLVEFGARVHCIVNGHYLSEWDPRTQEGFIVGFTRRRNTYRAFIPREGRVVESSDIVFSDHRTPECKNCGKGRIDEEAVKLLFNGASTEPSQVRLGALIETNSAEGGRGPATSTPTANNRGKILCTGERLDQFSKSYYESRAELESAEQGEPNRCADESKDQEPIYENVTERPRDPPPPPPLSFELSDSTVTELAPLEPSGDAEIGLLNVEIGDEVPSSYTEATSREFSKLWMPLIDEELEALEQNETWELVETTPSMRPLSTKWVFSVKKNAEGEVTKYKARLVVRGFEQSIGVDFFQTFAPVARFESLRSLLAVSAAKRLTRDVAEVPNSDIVLTAIILFGPAT